MKSRIPRMILGWSRMKCDTGAKSETATINFQISHQLHQNWSPFSLEMHQKKKDETIFSLKVFSSEKFGQLVFRRKNWLVLSDFSRTELKLYYYCGVLLSDFYFLANNKHHQLHSIENCYILRGFFSLRSAYTTPAVWIYHIVAHAQPTQLLFVVESFFSDLCKI